MLKTYFLPILTVAFVGQAHAVAETADQLPAVTKNQQVQYAGCPGGPPPEEEVKAVDFSQQADVRVLDRVKASGVTVILRYYDWQEGEPNDEKFDFTWKSGPTRPGKTLTKEERDLIFSKGFDIGVVFQHHSDDIRTFLDTKRAAYDAKRALQLAQELSQPENTILGFGVDFNARREDIEHVKSYFRTVKDIIEPARYLIGVYGNGYVCEELGREGLISWCWLSQSTGFYDSEKYAASGKWDIKQCAERKAFSGTETGFDPDIINNLSKTLLLWRGK